MSGEWWKKAVIYHIYPRSFQDSNGDGIGDLPGITSRLDYLKWLGADAIWISPVYPSPMADFGYDVSDHTDIDPAFGSIADMDALISAAHNRDIKVVLDFVPNHTSNEHPWFLESKSSRTNPKRDWYYWKDPKPDGSPPNNWLSRFDGKSAWKFDDGTGQYYLHTFLEEQPDLNWRNPEVRAAMQEILRFWFKRGVDGFRVDVSYRVMKHPDFEDNPLNPDWTERMDPSFRVTEKNTKNTPDIHQFNRWIRETADEFDNKVTIGEMNLSIEQLCKHFGTPEKPEFHLPFNFRLIFSAWTKENVKRYIHEFNEFLPVNGWPNWVLSNHDQPRFATRAGAKQTRNGHLLLFTVKGTPTLYYGDELGMENVEIPPDRVQDPWELLTPGLGLGRDPVRTPMRWNDRTHAGFTKPASTPWLPLGKDASHQNVSTQRKTSGSMLRFVKELIQIRKESKALLLGDINLLENLPDAVLGYVRHHIDDSNAYLVLINFSDETVPLDEAALFSEMGLTRPSLHCLLATEGDQNEIALHSPISILPNQGLLFSFQYEN
ncbi:MAG: hypothetical protein LAT67_06860 [Balneolales bacterium]|nr:hypothetical protein [Balneolales bacterium]